MTVPVSDRLSQLYVGNGINQRFDFTFRVFNQESENGVVIRQKTAVEFVTLDPSHYTVTLNQDNLGGHIDFIAPPESNVYFYIAGATALDQLLDITNYDNFYPDAIERALDKLTALLQEWGTQLDQEKQARILADIQYDALAMEREENLENRLISYINAVVGITNPAIFEGISDRMIITEDGRTQREFNQSVPFWTNDYASFKQETYLREEQILVHVNQQDQNISTGLASEVLRATTAEQNIQTQIDALGVGNKAYLTYADMDADKASIPANSKVTVTSDPDTTKRGDWQWNGTIFTKSPYDPITQANAYTDTKTFGINTHLIDSIKAFDSSLVFKSVVSNGASVPVSPVTGDCYLAKDTGTTFSIEVEQGQLLIKTASGWRVGDFLEKFRADLETKGGACRLTTLGSYLINGYINNLGAFVASGAGFKLTYFKPVKVGDTLKFSAHGSTSASVISFWDENRVFVSGVLGNDSSAERVVVVPANVKYVRVSNVSTVNASPYCYIDLKGVIVDSNAITPDSFTLIPSLNLAKTSLIVADKYVNNTGTISNLAGWEYIKIPVVAGSTYTFGRFTIYSGGYFAFYDATSVYIAGTVTSFNNGSLPVTVVAHENAAFLLIDIKRPTGINDRSQLTVNVGGTLIDYVEPVDTITRIDGYLLAGSGGGDTPLPEDVVVQGGNATLADLISDSLTTGALVANLPTSPIGLEVGQAYIDSGFIKVVT
ncbi:hypothetical protein [Acinetobacter beijerinckii]|uniref:hypothetical protein n=1 Tax=Acinetobacter beijerinckii TaxID=262668 RepID=UPI003AF7AD03